MKLLVASLLIVSALGALGTRAQAQALPTAGGLALDVGATYTTIHANEGPGQCGCFYMSGGSAEFSVKNEHNVAFVTSVSGTYQGNINNIQQNLTLLTILEGVRYSRDRGGRFVPFGEAAVGFAHTMSNYVVYKNTNAAAAQVGGGLDIRVSRRFSLRAAQVDYLFTSSPNGQNNFQNEIRYGAGIVFHLNPSKR
jgi:hypothetical protein